MTTSYFLGHNIVFCYQRREIKSNTNLIKLGGRESNILLLLLESPNTLLSKAFINDNVWGNILVAETSLTKAVSNIRKALANFPNINLELKTFPKQGYMLVAEMEILKSAAISGSEVKTENEVSKYTLMSEMATPKIANANQVNTSFFWHSSLWQVTLIALLASISTVFFEAIISRFNIF
ncbi:hypothetical protein CGJ34_08460 [Vibrio parahaemolyticus]|uniref:winged helix-turn-helix domain-containing protein n=1 Tax=Vibrio parahaemolyticus TaxID=670 RepID=UPI001121E4DD|nr:winged helix-turn-helix domain-containing protein [Vibrio parahaemolyticus]TOE84574.1 hypothetical protein CGJ34_08460 [Vibrio parahaemolyticus]